MSIGGSVVEFSPATRVTRVRFPANAVVFTVNSLSQLEADHYNYIILCKIHLMSIVLVSPGTGVRCLQVKYINPLDVNDVQGK